MTKRTDWANQQERSNTLLLRIMTWLSLRLGRRAGRALLHLIALYFVLFSPRACAASRDYLRRVLGLRPAPEFEAWLAGEGFARLQVEAGQPERLLPA